MKKRILSLLLALVMLLGLLPTALASNDIHFVLSIDAERHRDACFGSDEHRGGAYLQVVSQRHGSCTGRRWRELYRSGG